MKFVLFWSLQDVRDARAVGYAAISKWNQPKREKYISVIKTERNWRSEECFDIRHGDVEFRVCLAGFQSCFSLVFPRGAPFPPIWDGNVYPMALYVESMWVFKFELLEGL